MVWIPRTRFLERWLRRGRTRLARAWVPRGANVLDIGCHQGEFLAALDGFIGPSVGIDPVALAESTAAYRLQPEPFAPPTLFANATFDVVVILATLHYLPDPDAVCRECFRLLRPGGRVIVTLPSARGQRVASWYCRLRGEGSAGRHDALATPRLFGHHGFILDYWRPIQFGLNLLFILRKPARVTVLDAEAEPRSESAVHV